MQQPKVFVRGLQLEDNGIKNCLGSFLTLLSYFPDFSLGDGLARAMLSKAVSQRFHSSRLDCLVFGFGGNARHCVSSCPEFQ